jgi:hypothetical protein
MKIDKKASEPISHPEVQISSCPTVVPSKQNLSLISKLVCLAAVLIINAFKEMS